MLLAGALAIGDSSLNCSLRLTVPNQTKQRIDIAGLLRDPFTSSDFKYEMNHASLALTDRYAKLKSS